MGEKQAQALPLPCVGSHFLVVPAEEAWFGEAEASAASARIAAAAAATAAATCDLSPETRTPPSSRKEGRAERAIGFRGRSERQSGESEEANGL